MDLNYVSRFVELLSEHTEYPPPNRWQQSASGLPPLSPDGRVLKGANLDVFPFHAGVQVMVDQPANVDLDEVGLAPGDGVLRIALFTTSNVADKLDTWLEYALVNGSGTGTGARATRSRRSRPRSSGWGCRHDPRGRPQGRPDEAAATGRRGPRRTAGGGGRWMGAMNDRADWLNDMRDRAERDWSDRFLSADVDEIRLMFLEAFEAMFEHLDTTHDGNGWYCSSGDKYSSGQELVDAVNRHRPECERLVREFGVDNFWDLWTHVPPWVAELREHGEDDR